MAYLFPVWRIEFHLAHLRSAVESDFSSVLKTLWICAVDTRVGLSVTEQLACFTHSAGEPMPYLDSGWNFYVLLSYYRLCLPFWFPPIVQVHSGRLTGISMAWFWLRPTLLSCASNHIAPKCPSFGTRSLGQLSFLMVSCIDRSSGIKVMDWGRVQ